MMSSIRQLTISEPKVLEIFHSQVNVILVSNYNFRGEHKDELTVCKGDLLKFIEKRENGWILVKFLDKLNHTGLVPASYVDIVINDIKNPINTSWLNDNGDFGQGTKDIRGLSDPVPIRSSRRSGSVNEIGIATHTVNNKSRTASTPTITFNNDSKRLTARSKPHINTSISVPGTSTDTRFGLPSPESPIFNYNYQLTPAVPENTQLANQIISISISNCLVNDSRYWYRLDIKTRTQKLYIGKFYQDFYNLHLQLLQYKIQLPRLPDPISMREIQQDEQNGRNEQLVTLLLKRCNELNYYINKLNKLNLKEFVDWLNLENNRFYTTIGGGNDEINERILPDSTNLFDSRR